MLPVPTIFNPLQLQQKDKQALALTALSHAKVGFYKIIPIVNAIKYAYIETTDFQPSRHMLICDVVVTHEHVLDAVRPYSLVGMQTLASRAPINPNQMPVVVNTVSQEFNGTNLERCEGTRDDIIMIRTTFSRTILPADPKYPLKSRECVYHPLLTTVRPQNPMIESRWYPYEEIYTCAVITAAPITITDKIDDSTMRAHDYIATMETVEAIFQTAIFRNHVILVLPPFGIFPDGNPIDDIISIFNLCILKYSCAFSKIIIAIPPHYPSEVFEKFNADIIRPIALTSIVDDQREHDIRRRLTEPAHKHESATASDMAQLTSLASMLKKQMKHDHAHTSVDDRSDNAGDTEVAVDSDSDA